MDVLRSFDALMITTYQRMSTGLYFDNNLKPYRREFFEKVLNYFIEKEQYEECSIIRDIIESRFNHDDELNFKNFKHVNEEGNRQFDQS